MALSEFITHEVDQIVGEWEEFAKTRLDAARNLSTAALRDHARVLLLNIAADMGANQSAAEQQAKSRGERPGNAPQVTDSARDHAQHRFYEGFTLNEMVAEYRALRASVLRLWARQRAAVTDCTIDELIRFEEAMDQALTESIAWYSARLEESRDLLLGVLGHDLRNPLGAIRSSAQYLLQADMLDGIQTKAVTRILNSSNRMVEMVSALLDFTRTRLGTGIPIALAPAHLGRVCRQAVEELEAFHPDRTFRVQCSGNLAGHWDARRLGQMVSNLVANAIQHGAPDKPVTVTVRGEGDIVTLQVHNEGPPIAMEVREDLFEPLRHAKSAKDGHRDGASGLGLGLYIARQIAVAHGGSIELLSSTHDGTAFTVHLPRVAQAGQPPSGHLI